MKTQRKRRASAGNQAPAAASLPQAVRPASAPSADTVETRPPLSRRARLAISLLLLFHLAAVFVAALRVPPVSQLGVSTAEAMAWYTDVVLVNPGYRFFAPEPDASQMLRVEIVGSDGSQREEIYPDLKRQWPRLLYHRHFMLTSRMQRAPGDPTSLALVDSYARHLFAREGAQELRIFRREHRLPSRDDVLSGLTLTDASLYTTPYFSLVGKWATAVGPREATQLDLELRADFTASLVGRIRGQPARESFRWRFNPPPGPPRVHLFAGGEETSFCTADAVQEHELVLHYPLPGGVSRVAAIEHVSLRRDPPPLIVYRGEQP